MALESLLSLFQADVADSAMPDSEGGKGQFATAATAEKFVPLQPKPAPLLGCTSATSATAEIINSECEPAIRSNQTADQTKPCQAHGYRSERASMGVEVSEGSGINTATARARRIPSDTSDTPSTAETADSVSHPANDSAPPPIRYASPERLADTRRTCRQCLNLAHNGRCLAAARGELPMTARQYEPIPDRLERCVAYSPNADDTDQRPGKERYFSLHQRLWAMVREARR